MKLCINHKLELWKRNYGSAQALAKLPTAYCAKLCDICNGKMMVNRESFIIEFQRTPTNPTRLRENLPQ